jgi:PAS domain S-box-containing protein
MGERDGPDVVAWQNAADTLPIVVYSARPDGTVDFVNRRWTQMLGHPASAALGNSWRGLIHPDDLGAVVAQATRAIAAGQRFTTECRFRGSDGRYFWIATSAAPRRDASGRIVRWFGTAFDIDERKRALEALRASRSQLADSERRFRALAEAIPVVCFTADASGAIDWYNRRWYELTGQAPEDALGWGWQAAHHPDDFLEVMKRWPHSIATGEPFEMEFRLRRHDGQFRWFLSRIEPLHDASGRLTRWYGSNVDIDAQKRALERTKRIAETLQDAFLPSALPLRDGLRFDAVYLPAERDALVGGDWYDAFELPDGRIVLSIGDVTGHGLQASMSVGRLRQAIYVLAFSIDDPATILARLNDMLEHQDPGTIVTALVGTIDPAQRRFTYAAAGHPPPMVAYRNDAAARIAPSGGLPLGLGLGDGYWVTHAVNIEPDTVVATYTDGVVEFGRDAIDAEKRLAAAIALLVGNTTIARPARAVQQLVFDGARTRDDAALLLIQFSSVDPKALNSDPSAFVRTWRFHSSDAHTAHTSRREIVGFLRGLAADVRDLFTCELVLGEILANTVEHAPGLVEVSVDWTMPHPLVTVRDSGPGLANRSARLPDDLLSEDGRGMYLIQALAADVTVKPASGYGTEMRVVLPVNRRP